LWGKLWGRLKQKLVHVVELKNQLMISINPKVFVGQTAKNAPLRKIMLIKRKRSHGNIDMLMGMKTAFITKSIMPKTRNDFPSPERNSEKRILIISKIMQEKERMKYNKKGRVTVPGQTIRGLQNEFPKNP
jgi:hypothetical protein